MAQRLPEIMLYCFYCEHSRSLQLVISAGGIDNGSYVDRRSSLQHRIYDTISNNITDWAMYRVLRMAELTYTVGRRHLHHSSTVYFSFNPSRLRICQDGYRTSQACRRNRSQIHRSVQGNAILVLKLNYYVLCNNQQSKA